MKIFISYPPLESEKGIPLLGQNRQFQWFSSPTYIYPVIPAYLATLLQQHWQDVIWDDGIAENLNYETWLSRLLEARPDLVVIETKTPVIKRHWKIINELKEKADWEIKIVLVGDHVTAQPEESLKNSKVDYVLAGGDYDFGVLNLVRFLQGKAKLEPGWYWLECNNLGDAGENKNINVINGEFKNCELKNSGLKQDYELHDLNTLPEINRELTNWQLYAYKNGNFKYTPGTYMMSARDCWYGRCTFCSWTTLFPGSNIRTRSARLALDEVGNLINLGVKEIMEDSGSLPIGLWLHDFCRGMIERGYNKKVTMSCNMRINGITDPDTWKLMKEAGFRFILFGLESANQITLNKINKNLKVEEIEPNLRMCKKAGLEPHITAMIGYPWETYSDAKQTIELAKRLFRKNYVNTLQGTILIPYPGTPLYKHCLDNNLLNFTDYDRFDQREQVMKCPLSNEQIKELTQDLYKSFLTPAFFFNNIKSVRDWGDIKFLWMAGIKVLGHLFDFKK